MFGQFDFGKVSLPDGLEEPVLADVGLLPCPPGGDPGGRTAIASLEKREKEEEFLKNCALFSRDQ